MVTLAALLLNFGGVAFIALSMRKHYRQVFVAEPSKVAARIRRTAGWLLLGSSLMPFLIGESSSVGVVMWIGVLTVSAVSVTMLLTYRPRAVMAVACDRTHGQHQAAW